MFFYVIFLVNANDPDMQSDILLDGVFLRFYYAVVFMWHFMAFCHPAENICKTSKWSSNSCQATILFVQYPNSRLHSIVVSGVVLWELLELSFQQNIGKRKSQIHVSIVIMIIRLHIQVFNALHLYHTLLWILD